MFDLTALRILVIEWTKKAQSSSITDDERNVYYEVSHQLHDVLDTMEE